MQYVVALCFLLTASVRSAANVNAATEGTCAAIDIRLESQGITDVASTLRTIEPTSIQAACFVTDVHAYTMIGVLYRNLSE